MYKIFYYIEKFLISYKKIAFLLVKTKNQIFSIILPPPYGQSYYPSADFLVQPQKNFYYPRTTLGRVLLSLRRLRSPPHHLRHLLPPLTRATSATRAKNSYYPCAASGDFSRVALRNFRRNFRTLLESSG